MIEKQYGLWDNGTNSWWENECGTIVHGSYGHLAAWMHNANQQPVRYGFQKEAIAQFEIKPLPQDPSASDNTQGAE